MASPATALAVANAGTGLTACRNGPVRRLGARLLSAASGSVPGSVRRRLLPYVVPGGNGANSAVSLDEEAAQSAAREVVQHLSSSDADAQARAATRLADLIDGANGDDAMRLAAFLRSSNSLELLVELLDRTATQQDALRILGNLASSAVDVNAAETKQLLDRLGAFPRVLPLIYSRSTTTVVYALGSVQNMCARREYALQMRAIGADERLREIVERAPSEDDQAKHFARGCLSNMDAVLAPNFVPDPRLTAPLPWSPASLDEMLPTPPVPSELTLHATPSAVDEPEPERPLSEGTPVCSVCVMRAIDTAMVPCFHAHFCNQCASMIVRSRLPCPICRGAVQSVQRIYLP